MNAAEAKSLSTRVEDLATAILDLARGFASEAVDVAFGVYVWGEDIVQRLLPRLREAGFSGRIILGGPQISYAGEGVDRVYPEGDAFVRGYGELALYELAIAPGQPQIAGVTYRGMPDRGEQTATNLDLLPSPWLETPAPVAGSFLRWETQRGCPYRCSFCQHREAGSRLRRRALPPARIASEVDLFCSSGVADIAVLDPIFNLGPHAPQILNRFSQHGFRGGCRCNAERNSSTRNSWMPPANSILVSSSAFRPSTMRESAAVDRRNDIKKIDAALSRVRRRQISHEVSLIFGLPEQTVDSFRETVSWCLERRVPVIKAFPLILLRGTGLDRDRARWGLVDDGGSMSMVVASNSFGRIDWLEMAKIAEALRLTEAQHPTRLSELLEIARSVEPNLHRWRSEST